MPIYAYYCEKCDPDAEWEAFNSINDRHSVLCPECGDKALIAMSITARPVIQEYYSDNLQAQITGPAQKKRLMKAKGLEETG